jgi:DNA-binding NarL/FixJ family response regulator
VRTVLADDEPAVLDALIGLFASTDRMEVVATAATGDELVDLIEQQRPHLVVTDVFMPGGGEAMFDRIALLEHRPVVIAVSGMASPALRRRITATGADRLLRKGLDNPLHVAIDVLASGAADLTAP